MGKGANDKDRTWTIYDIAKAAGVSAKTVSRVVNNQPGVGEETRERISQLIRQVGYHPHLGARIMRSNPRDCVGVAVCAPPNEVCLSEQLIQRMFAELYRIFGSRGDFICLDLNPFIHDAHADYARGLWEQRYTACIVCGPIPENDKTIVRIHESGHPYLALGRVYDIPDCSCAAVDYEAGAYMSTKFLLNRGHKRIGLLKGLRGYLPNIERRRGYTRALDEAGIVLDEDLLCPVLFGSDDIVNGVQRMLKDGSVTALIDSSGAEDADSLREGARLAGRQLGSDCDVISWTYTCNASVLAEACAHVWLPVVEACFEGFQALARWFHGEGKGPIHIVRQPVLYEHVSGVEIAKPGPFFRLLP